MTSTIDDIKQRADSVEELRKKYRNDARYQRVVQAFFEIDPIGINFETNTDEYDLEATLLMPVLDRMTSVEMLSSVIRAIFLWAFGGDLARGAARAGIDYYRRCADELVRLNLVHSLRKT